MIQLTRGGWLGRAAILSAGLLLAGAAGGCLTEPSGTPSDGQGGAPKPADGCPARVHIVRGLWDVFSIGLNSLGDEMRAVGIDANVVSGADWPALLEQLIAEADAGIDTPIVLIGHSYGADDVIEIARQLRKYDVTVQFLGLIDSTDPGRIPDNVDHCVHLYLPNALGSVFPDAFSGNPVTAESGNTRTFIENITVTSDNFGSAVNGVDHFNIESSEVVHRFMVEEAVAICLPDEE